MGSYFAKVIYEQSKVREVFAGVRSIISNYIIDIIDIYRVSTYTIISNFAGWVRNCTCDIWNYVWDISSRIYLYSYD